MENWQNIVLTTEKGTSGETEERNEAWRAGEGGAYREGEDLELNQTDRNHQKADINVHTCAPVTDSVSVQLSKSLLLVTCKNS